jgi:hypothetical protein
MTVRIVCIVSVHNGCSEVISALILYQTSRSSKRTTSRPVACPLLPSQNCRSTSCECCNINGCETQALILHQLLHRTVRDLMRCPGACAIDFKAFSLDFSQSRASTNYDNRKLARDKKDDKKRKAPSKSKKSYGKKKFFGRAKRK